MHNYYYTKYRPWEQFEALPPHIITKKKSPPPPPKEMVRAVEEAHPGHLSTPYRDNKKLMKLTIRQDRIFNLARRQAIIVPKNAMFKLWSL
jgi:hypothetical protein